MMNGFALNNNHICVPVREHKTRFDCVLCIRYENVSFPLMTMSMFKQFDETDDLVMQHTDRMVKRKLYHSCICLLQSSLTKQTHTRTLFTAMQAVLKSVLVSSPSSAACASCHQGIGDRSLFCTTGSARMYDGKRNAQCGADIVSHG